MNKKAIRKELTKVRKQEDKFIYSAVESRSLIADVILKRIPQKAYGKLRNAFGKAFNFIYVKGSVVINETYDKNKMRDKYEEDRRFAKVVDSRLSIKAFQHKSFLRSLLDGLIVLITGTVLGFLGISLPYIPLFVSITFRNMNQTCLCYGYDCDDVREKILLLKMMEVSLSTGEDAETGDSEMDDMIEYVSKGGAFAEDEIDRRIKAVSDRLADKTLYMRFIQTIPIIGTVFGFCDIFIFSKIHRYIDIKYRKRFLLEALEQ